MLRRSTLFVALATATLALACTSSKEREVDAGIMFMPPDPTPDAGDGDDAATGPSDIGTACASSDDCGSGYCLSEAEGFAGGYCTAICLSEEECPGGSSCVFFDDTMGLCLDQCDPAAAERECRQFYGCAQDFSLPAPVCVPGCTDDTDCSEGRACDPGFGGRCYNPDGVFGGACDQSEDCGMDQRCFSDRRGYPDGMCVSFGCEPIENTGCPPEGQCIPGGRSGFGRCLPGCTEDADCRDGYRCGTLDAYPDRGFCTPRCRTDFDCDDGEVCNDDTGICEIPAPPDAGVADAGTPDGGVPDAG